MVQGSKEWLDKNFPIIEASKLSLKDKFLEYEPKTNHQKRLKRTLTVAINAGLNDFRRPAMDPSFKDDKIVYEAGLMPATGKSFNWWSENAKKFMPEKNSRLGTGTQYDAFLGVLIKYLINEGVYTVSKAWWAVCDDSKELGHYCNSKNAKGSFEATGSRRIGLFYDLANTNKFLSHDNDNSSDFLFAGGSYKIDSYSCPLSFWFPISRSDPGGAMCVGWLVLDV